jgi:hypothetical protein
MPKKKEPKPIKQPAKTIDFRAIESNGTYSIGLYVQDTLDEKVFTLDKEPKDVTARRLCDAFTMIFNVAVDLGSKSEQARAHLATPDAQPTEAEEHDQDTTKK